jgi:hypothetical protein
MPLSMVFRAQIVSGTLLGGCLLSASSRVAPPVEPVQAASATVKGTSDAARCRRRVACGSHPLDLPRMALLLLWGEWRPQP